ncbi:unnamed protein product [Ilex paraguariensis]|uniref:FAD/NAD(P)-binding domain-containing protein n=1 Tax=Ilex paraguariensis TaxID=185542 RepID=A0ABC8T496_9AQUA
MAQLLSIGRQAKKKFIKEFSAHLYNLLFLGCKIEEANTSGVRLVRGIVKDVQPQKIVLTDGTEVPYGLLVWSTVVGPSAFVNSLEVPKTPGGRIGVDEWLRILSLQDVFSIGDCSGFLESTGKPVLPALAQVAERQGKYLAKRLNRIGKAAGGRANAAKGMEPGKPFVYRHLGSMATIGRYKALVDLRQSKRSELQYKPRKVYSERQNPGPVVKSALYSQLELNVLCLFGVSNLDLSSEIVPK